MLSQSSVIKKEVGKLYSELLSEFGSDYLSEIANVQKRVLKKAASKGSIPVVDHYHIFDNLNLSPEALYDKKIDIKTLKDHLKGNLKSIPKKYSHYRCSKVRTCSTIFESLENYNPHISSKLMRYFQINNEILEDKDDFIGSALAIDIYDYLLKKKCPSKFFFDLGRECALEFKKSTLTSSLPLKKHSKDLYGTFFSELTSIVEKNQDYKIISKNTRRMILSHKIKDETKELLNIDSYGGPSMCEHIRGWFSAFMQFNSPDDAKVTKLSCVHQGDEDCRYEIDYSHYRALQ